MMTITDTPTRGVDLIEDTQVDRIVRIMRDEFNITDRALERVDQMVAFMHTTAGTDEHLWCSEGVDPAWHAFILDTERYAAYCQQEFGKFLHHHPFVEGDLINNTIEAMRRRGFVVDESLWAKARYCY
jgi:hypothetical protein